MDGSFHFVQHKVIGTSQDEGGRGVDLGSLDENAFIVGDSLLDHFFGLAEEGSIKGFLSLEVGKGRDKGS